jgi:hypothetical protein
MALTLRPTFSVRVEQSSEVVAHRLHRRLMNLPLESRWSRVPGASREVARDRTHVLLALTAARRRFWSPWLHLDIREAEGGAELFGRYSPHPNVWTAYALGYLLLGAVIFLGSLFAAAQQMVHGDGHALWGVVAALVAAVLMWWSALVGQRLARDQMEELDSHFRNALSSSD